MIHTPITQFASAGTLGLNGKEFLIQLITFLIVFLLLMKYAFKPILKVLKERRELIESGVKIGQEMQKKEIEVEAEAAEKLKKARLDADKIISSAQQEARQLAQEAEDKTRAKQDQIVNEAKERIKQETIRSRKKLEGELVGLITETTTAIIGEEIDAKKDAAILQRILKDREAA